MAVGNGMHARMHVCARLHAGAHGWARGGGGGLGGPAVAAGARRQLPSGQPEELPGWRAVTVAAVAVHVDINRRVRVSVLYSNISHKKNAHF